MNKYVYYNVIISNKGDKLEQDASIHIRLGSSLLDNPSEYKMGVQKFSIDGEALPVSIIELKNPQTPKTQDWETVHNVYIVNSSGQVATANVLFNTERIPNVPPIPVKVENGLAYYNNKDPYFFIWTYTYLIRKINEALQKAYSQLFSDTNYPRFVYDPISQLITFNVPIASQANYYFNMSLRKYVGEGFAGPFVFTGAVPGINEDTYSIDITTNSINDPDTNSTFLAIPQEYCAITSFNTINGILIQSKTLPIRSEYFPANYHRYSLVGSSNSSEQYTNMNSFPIISVFYPHSTKAGDFRGKIIYSKDSLVDGDLIDLQSNSPLNELQISVFFTDNFNNVSIIISSR